MTEQQRLRDGQHQNSMALSMRSLLSADTTLPDDLRAVIARGAPESARQLMSHGLNACEAAELLDEPCVALRESGIPGRSR